jgi:biotin carboxylase
MNQLTAFPVLVLASDDDLPYRVVRCVSDAGLKPHVLGISGSAAARLAQSRYCRSYRAIPREVLHSGAAVGEINALIRELAIELVIASDQATTRFLSQHGMALTARVLPVPDHRLFEHLLAKDRFAALCSAHGLPHPRTRTCATPDELLALLDQGLPLPVMIKPTNLEGGNGVFKITRNDRATRMKVAALSYRPILVQAFVAGDELSAMLLCEQGRLLASIVYHTGPREYRVLQDRELLELMQRASRELRLHGVIGFDLLRQPAGPTWLIECNPRFTYGGSLVSALAGYNFVRAFLAPDSVPAQAPAAIVHRAKLFRPWTLVAADQRHTRFLLSDARVNFARACRDFWHVKIQRPLRTLATTLR